MVTEQKTAFVSSETDSKWMSSGSHPDPSGLPLARIVLVFSRLSAAFLIAKRTRRSRHILTSKELGFSWDGRSGAAKEAPDHNSAPSMSMFFFIGLNHHVGKADRVILAN